jgi:hypothetical protein
MRIIVLEPDGLNREGHEGGGEEETYGEFELKGELELGGGCMSLPLRELMEEGGEHDFIEDDDEEY